MRTMRYGALGLLVLALTGADAAGPVELKLVKYPELGKAVRALKGRVVVVDFWADT